MKVVIRCTCPLQLILGTFASFLKSHEWRDWIEIEFGALLLRESLHLHMEVPLQQCQIMRHIIDLGFVLQK